MSEWKFSATHSVDLIESLPLLVRHAQGLGSLNGPLHLTRPHLQIADVLRVDELSQDASKLKDIRIVDALKLSQTEIHDSILSISVVPSLLP